MLKGGLAGLTRRMEKDCYVPHTAASLTTRWRLLWRGAGRYSGVVQDFSPPQAVTLGRWTTWVVADYSELLC